MFSDRVSWHNAQENAAMKLYVGNLAYSVSESDLRDLFNPFGEIREVKIITDRFSGKSKGFAFVEMSSRTEGQEAMENLNGKEVQDRKIVVNEARPQTKKGPGGGRGFRR